MIYFIRDRRDSRIKIGLSRDPWQRMRELAVTAPDSLELLAVMDGNRDTEAGLHSLFKHLRTAGEWFQPEPDLLRFIEGIKPHHSQKRRSDPSRIGEIREPPSFQPTARDLLEMEINVRRSMRKKSGLAPENHPADLLDHISVGHEIAHMCERLQFLIVVLDCRNRGGVVAEPSLIDAVKLLEHHVAIVTEVATLFQNAELGGAQAQPIAAADTAQAEMKAAE